MAIPLSTVYPTRNKYQHLNASIDRDTLLHTLTGVYTTNGETRQGCTSIISKLSTISKYAIKSSTPAIRMESSPNMKFQVLDSTEKYTNSKISLSILLSKKSMIHSHLKPLPITEILKESSLIKIRKKPSTEKLPKKKC